MQRHRKSLYNNRVNKETELVPHKLLHESEGVSFLHADMSRNALQRFPVGPWSREAEAEEEAEAEAELVALLHLKRYG